MSSIISLKSQDPTRIDIAQAIRQYSANKNLGNAKFCTQSNNIVDEFGRPGNPRNLINTANADCAQYTYPINTFLQNENSIRPAQLITFLNTKGSGDTLAKGSKRDLAVSNLYNSSTHSQTYMAAPNTSLYEGTSNTQPIVFDPATLRNNPQNTPLVQLS